MPDRPESPRIPVLTRRAAVAGLAGGLAGLTGCDADRGAGTPGADVSDGVDPDTALVERVTGQLTELLALVTAAEARFPSLAPRVRPFRQLHTAHLRALGAEPSSGGATARPSSGAALDRVHSAAAAWREVAGREEAGRRRLVDASVAAASGALARLLASMSAGVSQQLAPSGRADGRVAP